MNRKIFLIASISIIIIGIVIINLYINNSTKKYIYRNINDIPRSQAVLVLGAAVYSKGRLSDILQDRLLTAISIYKAGKVDKFILSGDHGKKRYDEVNAMKDFLLLNDISSDDIFLDYAGFETYDSIYRAKNIFMITSMIITTQNYHLARSLYIAKNLGINSYGFSADRQQYLNIIWYIFREDFAKVKSFFKVSIKSKPKFLGEIIPINGDGRKSWDSN